MKILLMALVVAGMVGTVIPSSATTNTGLIESAPSGESRRESRGDSTNAATPAPCSVEVYPQCVPE